MQIGKQMVWLLVGSLGIVCGLSAHRDHDAHDRSMIDDMIDARIERRIEEETCPHCRERGCASEMCRPEKEHRMHDARREMNIDEAVENS